MKVAILLVGILAVSAATGFASGPDSLWMRVYGGASHDYANCVRQTSDGGYVMVGLTWSFDLNGGDMWIVKTDADGDSLWHRAYGWSGSDEGYWIEQTFDGGFIAVGTAQPPPLYSYDVHIVKTDANGDLTWYKTYGGPDSDHGFSVQQTADSGYVVAASLGDRMWLLRLDAQGDTIWTNQYARHQYSQDCFACETSDGGLIAIGAVYMSGGRSDDVYLIKTDSVGQRIWERVYNIRGIDAGYHVIETSDGDFVATGRVWDLGPGASDMLAAKVDADGDSIWLTAYGGIGDEFGYDVEETPDGGYIFSGMTTSFGEGAEDFYLVRTHIDATVIWTKTFGGTSDDWCRAAQPTADGGFIAAGHTWSFGAELTDALLIKTDLDPTSSVLLDDPGLDGTTSLKCYPSPTRGGRVRIGFGLNRAGRARLSVYNLMGQLVRVIGDRTWDAGIHSAVWDCADFRGSRVAAGIYFIECVRGGRKEVAKVLVTR